MDMKIKRGQILKTLRMAKGLSQSILSNMLNISLQAYQKYEYGTAEPTFDSLCKLADFYGVTTDYLLGREVSKSEESENEMTVEEMENDIVDRWLKLGEIGREIVYNMLLSMVDLAEAKKKEESQQQVPEPPIVQSIPQNPSQPVEPSCLPIPVEQPVVIQKSIQIETSEPKPWRMAARSADGRYTTRTLTPEEVELIDSLEDVPKSRY